MADHKHGTMDITQNQNTFNGFVKFMTRSTILILVVLMFMALAGA